MCTALAFTAPTIPITPPNPALAATTLRSVANEKSHEEPDHFSTVRRTPIETSPKKDAGLRTLPTKDLLRLFPDWFTGAISAARCSGS